MANKYGAKKVIHNGHKFDSQAEFYRYLQLKDELERGEISDLILQPKFVLIPAFRDSTGNPERAATYKADFQYQRNGKTVVEDVKSVPTRAKPDYVLRRKLLKTRYPDLIFKEVA